MDNSKTQHNDDPEKIIEQNQEQKPAQPLVEDKDEQKGNQIINGLTEQDEAIYNTFFEKPFIFIPPPITTDQTSKAYRDNLLNYVCKYSQSYDMFNQKYEISTGQKILRKNIEIEKQKQQDSKEKAGESRQNGDQKQKKEDELDERQLGNSYKKIKKVKSEQSLQRDQKQFHQNLQQQEQEAIKQRKKAKQSVENVFSIQIMNFKFLLYSFQSKLIQSIKELGKEGLSEQKLETYKKDIPRKMGELYSQSAELKKNYQRLQVIYMLQKQAQCLNQITERLNQQLKVMQDYIVNASFQQN